MDDTRLMTELRKRASNTLTILGKLLPFATAMSTELGQELMKDAIVRHEELLMKIAENNADDMDKGEFRYLRHWLPMVAKRIEVYNEKLKEVKQ